MSAKKYLTFICPWPVRG